MNAIEFAKDYRKLYCRVGDIFTTIRRDTVGNELRYEYSKGEIFQVKINGKATFKAKLLYCAVLVDGLNDVNFSLSLLEYDSEGNEEEFIDKYKSDGILLLIFQKIDGDV